MSLGPRSLLVAFITCALVVVPVAMFVVRPCLEGFLGGLPRGVRDAVIIGVALLLSLIGLVVAEGILVRWRRRKGRDKPEEKAR